MIALADGDLVTAREQAARSYRAAVAAQDMPLLALASGAVAELALALGQPERAAGLLGASDRGARRRGPDRPDGAEAGAAAARRPRDDRYAAAYEAGKALGRPEAIERLDPAGLG